MKVLSARAETMDAEDIQVLLLELNLKTADEVLEIVKGYYPHKQVNPAARILLEEVLKKVQ
jgi:hypothetical protein